MSPSTPRLPPFRWRTACLSLVVALSVATAIHAQVNVRVTATDDAGNLLGGAGVCLLDVDLGPAPCDAGPCPTQTTATAGAAEGTADFLGVPPDQYVLIAHLDGYVGARRELDLNAVRGVGTSVTVALAPGDPLSGPTCDDPDQGSPFMFPEGYTVPLLPWLLGITGFTLDGGAATTPDPDISIEFTTTLTGFFSPAQLEFRISENPDFEGAGWQEPTLVSGAPLPSYRAPVGFTLSELPGSKTVYLQARFLAAPDDTSAVVAADIDLLEKYVVSLASILYPLAQASGWTFSGQDGFLTVFRCDSFTSHATNWRPSGLVLQAVQGVWGFFPITCRFTLFGGRELNPGWFFDSYQITDGTTVPDVCDPEGRVTLATPPPGGTAIPLEVTVYTEVAYCVAVVESITLIGPPSRKFEEAFSP